MDILSEIRIQLFKVFNNLHILLNVNLWASYESIWDHDWLWEERIFDCNVTEFHEILIQSSLNAKKLTLSPDCRLFDLLCIYFSFFFSVSLSHKSNFNICISIGIFSQTDVVLHLQSKCNFCSSISFFWINKFCIQYNTERGNKNKFNYF
jgi:hypothetical protein